MTRPALRSALKTACRIAAGLSLLFFAVTAIPVLASFIYGRFQPSVLLEQLPGICAFALLSPFFSSVGRICTFDADAERAEIAREFDRIALIFAIMVVAGMAISTLDALANGVHGGISIALGTPGVSWGLVDIGSTPTGCALIRIDFFGLILAGFSKAASLAFGGGRSEPIDV